jgi:hypothetical protein
MKLVLPFQPAVNKSMIAISFSDNQARANHNQTWVGTTAYLKVFSPGSDEYRHGEDVRPNVKKLSLTADLVEVLIQTWF